MSTEENVTENVDTQIQKEETKETIKEQIQVEEDNNENQKKRKLEEDETKNKKPRVQKHLLPKKYAICIAYVGTNYNGLQIQPDAKTIEGEILNTLWENKIIPTKNTKDKRNMPWHRACRTDKGVHALRNIITAKLYPGIVEKEDFIEKFNEKLPKDIKFVCVQRVTDAFSAKNDCRRRRYLYYIPCSILLTNKTEFTTEDLQKFNEIIKKFEGSHIFHNFTVRVKPTDEEARRHMIKLEATGPIDLEGKQFIEVSIYGSSFLYNQIRKMMGAAISIMRGMQKLSIIDEALDPKNFVKFPIAPGYCLFLDKPEFTSYDNKIQKGVFQPLTFEKYDNLVEKYKRELILKEIITIEKEKKEFPDWLFQLQMNKYDYFNKKLWEFPIKKGKEEEKKEEKEGKEEEKKEKEEEIKEDKMEEKME